MDKTIFVPIRRIEADNTVLQLNDEIVTEHQLSLYCAGKPLVRLICTPENLEALIIGHLYTEGFIDTPADIRLLTISDDGTRADVTFRRPAEPAAEIPVRGTACGSKVQVSSESLHRRALRPLTPIAWDAQHILQCTETLLQQDRIFARTGGVHSCVLEYAGHLLDICEDLGRHNAIDKAVGLALQQGVDLSKCILYTSGRVPSDMIEKVVRSGIPVAVSHSAVTQAAVELAKKYRLTLFGFVRKTRLNLYWDPTNA